MNVVVTGGTGFIGSHITRHLVKEGHHVVVFDVFPTIGRVTDIKDRIELVRGNICDLEVILTTFKKYKIDHVVHTAAYLPEMAIRENPTKAIRINLVGTNNVFEASLAMDVKRVVYASTDAVNPHSLEEDAVVTPTTLYGHLKHMNEVMGRHFYDHFELETIGLRFCANFGPGRLLAGEISRQYGSGVTWGAFQPALMGQKVVAPFSSKFETNWIYVKDTARLVCMALQAPYPKRAVFMVPGEKHKLGDIADTIKKIVPSSEVQFAETKNAKREKITIRTVDRALTIDTALVKEAFGFSPKYSLEEGLREYHEEIVKNPHMYKPVKWESV